MFVSAIPAGIFTPSSFTINSANFFILFGDPPKQTNCEKKSHRLSSFDVAKYIYEIFFKEIPKRDLIERNGLDKVYMDKISL
jgi:hypothetical protein